MIETKLKVNEVAKEIAESVHVVRNWMRDFKEYIPTEKSEAGYNLFDQEAVSVLRIIQKLSRDQKFSTRQIEHYLATGGEAFGLAPEEAERNEKLDQILSRLDKQDEFNKALLHQLEERNRNFEKFVQDRDQKIMTVLREINVNKQLPGQRRKWYEFWRKD